MSTSRPLAGVLPIEGVAEITAVSLALDTAITGDAYLEVARTVEEVSDASAWWRGDASLQAPKSYGSVRRQAEALGVSAQTLMNSRSVCAAFEASRRRERLSFGHHAEVLGLSAELQDHLLDWAQERSASISALRKEKGRRRHALKAAAAKAVAASIAPSDRWSVLAGDLAEVGRGVPDASLDLIVCDPPYEEAALPLYSDLGMFAARTLEPGGSALVMTGNMFLPSAMQRLCEHLIYSWQVAYVFGGSPASVWARNVHQGWKPVLIFSRGKATHGVISDVIYGGGAEKDAHQWQQSEAGFRRLMEQFPIAGSHICDPFLGSGTTGAAAFALGCAHFLGIEIDPEVAADAKARLACAAEAAGPKER